MSAPRPWNLIAELTYRCPLRCSYCSNPVDWSKVRDGLDAAAWTRVFEQAAALGVLHTGLTGGEPTLRRDLPEIVAGAARAELYVHLVTSGLPIAADGLATLHEAGLSSVQLSLQDVVPDESDAVAGTACFARKLEFASEVRARGLPLTLNMVLHRRNLGRVDRMIALARELGAHRLELANTQYHGQALLNRDALLPTRAQLDATAEVVRRARAESDTPELVYVLPDYHAGRPKACMGGWARKNMVVAPDGRVLPCHGAAELPLEFWSARERPLAECWADAPGMNAYRGEAWMREPCRSCRERVHDFGGCRCQAFALTGDAAQTDPACPLSPRHDVVVAARAAAEVEPPPFRYRSAT